jgi:MFS family permease
MAPLNADISMARRRYALGTLLAIYTLAFIDRQILGILAVPIKAELMLSDTQLAMLGGLAFAVFYTTVSIPVAWLADRYNRSWIVTAALATWSAFTVMCGFAGSFGALFAGRIGVGIGEAGGTTPAVAMIADYFPLRERSRAMAVYSFGIPLGSSLGVLLGGWIAGLANWRFAFWTVGIAGVLLVPIFKLSVPEPKRPAVKAKPPTLAEFLKIVKAKPSFWAICLGASSSAVIGYGFSFWLPSFFQRIHHIPLQTIALQYGGIVLVGGIAGQWIGGYLCDKYGPANRSVYGLVPMLGMLLAAVLYAVGLFLPTTPFTVFYFVLPVIAYYSMGGAVFVGLHGIVPANARATVTSFLLFASTILGLGAGSLFFGLVSDWLHTRTGAESLRTAMVLALSFLLIGACLYAVAARYLPRDWHREPRAVGD